MILSLELFAIVSWITIPCLGGFSLTNHGRVKESLHNDFAYCSMVSSIVFGDESIRATEKFRRCPKQTQGWALSESIDNAEKIQIMPSSFQQQKIEDEGLYRPFAEYAWQKLVESSLIDDDNKKSELSSSSSGVPSELARNEAFLAGGGKSSGQKKKVVTIEVKSAVGKSTLLTSSDDVHLHDAHVNPVVRSVRYALLRTTTQKDKQINESQPQSTKGDEDLGTQVLNFVIFPSVDQPYVPVFGADLVSLPGNKHLIAVDFQPLLPLQPDDKVEDGYSLLANPILEQKLKDISLSFRDNGDSNVVLPWGGEIPDEAKRFFSPFALWTRISGRPDAVSIIHTDVYDIFRKYVDLYIEVLLEAEASAVTVESSDDNNQRNLLEKRRDDLLQQTIEGHISYLNYRRTNDPARPMLKRLFGENWTERLISEILFKKLPHE